MDVCNLQGTKWVKSKCRSAPRDKQSLESWKINDKKNCQMVQVNSISTIVAVAKCYCLIQLWSKAICFVYFNKVKKTIMPVKDIMNHHNLSNLKDCVVRTETRNVLELWVYSVLVMYKVYIFFAYLNKIYKEVCKW